MNCAESQRSLGLLADRWLKSEVAHIGTRFGRLVYFSSLLDRNTGRYNHRGLSQAVGDTEADRILRESHRQTFDEWLCLNLEQKKADLDLYLSGLGDEGRTASPDWARVQAYRDLPPLSAEEPERALFLADLEALFSLMTGEPALVDMPRPDENRKSHRVGLSGVAGNPAWLWASRSWRCGARCFRLRLRTQNWL